MPSWANIAVQVISSFPGRYSDTRISPRLTAASPNFSGSQRLRSVLIWLLLASRPRRRENPRPESTAHFYDLEGLLALMRWNGGIRRVYCPAGEGRSTSRIIAERRDTRGVDQH